MTLYCMKWTNCKCAFTSSISEQDGKSGVTRKNLWIQSIWTGCERVCGGSQLSSRWPDNYHDHSFSGLPTLTGDLQATGGTHTAIMASCSSPFDSLASQIPTERCPPLWLDEGSGTSDRLFLFTAGWVGHFWCRHALSCSVWGLIASLCMLPIYKKD